MAEEYVSVRLRLRELEGSVHSETPWAQPVDARDDGGTYRLANDLLFAALRVGDVVQCELDGNSGYQIVGVVSLVEGTLYTFEHPVDTEDVVVPIVNELVEAGCAVNRPRDGYVQSLVREPLQWARPLLGGVHLPDAWTLVEVLSAADRERAIDAEADFELDTSTLAPSGTVDYWAPDDGRWSELGVVDTDVLAWIQQLATFDPRVLATIRAGFHEDVLTYMERLSTTDPSALPPLDGPLLVDPDE